MLNSTSGRCCRQLSIAVATTKEYGFRLSLMRRRAASHWAYRELLTLFGAIPDPARVVRDGNAITGGGVTAGIDFALTVAAELRGDEVAQTMQLMLEYAPAPPFQCGRPEIAPPEIVEGVKARFATYMQARERAMREIADA